MKKEIRHIDAEIRLDETVAQQIGGYAIVYDSPSLDLGGFTEIIKPGACAESLKNNDICLLYCHIEHELMGRTSANTLTLTDDSVGVGFTHELPDTTRGRDVNFHIGKKNIRKMSFGFHVLEQNWLDTPTGLVREITKLDLFEISLVVNPAYEETSVDFRSYQEFIDSKKKDEVVEAVKYTSNDYLKKIISLHY